MRSSSVVACLIAGALLAACGGNDSALVGATATTTTSTTTTTVAVVPASLTATTSAASILADGSTTAIITVLARDASNNLIAGVPVAFTASSGGIAVTQATTDATGAALATLSTAGDSSPRSITVTAASGGKTATVSVQVVSATSAPTVVPASLNLTTSTGSILPDGTTTAIITALARNASNNLIAGVVVTFAANSGGLAVTQATTDTTGSALATLSTAGDSTPRTITVTATASGLSATVNVQVAPAPAAVVTAVASLRMSDSVASILTDGSSTAKISALALDAANNTMAGVPVTFIASSGSIQVTQASTNAAGMALATLSSGGDTSVRTITVTGSTAALSSTIQVPVIAPPTTPVYSMGNGSGTGFKASAIGIAVTGKLAAGGTTGLQVSIVDQTETLYTAAPVTVTLNSPCIASGTAQILASGSSTPVTTITTSTGGINATYLAAGCSGADLITATATLSTQSLSATGTVTVSPAAIGSIQFVSAAPMTIGLKGTGLNETSTVKFKVTDSGGNARAGVPVNFTLNTTVGGMSLSQTPVTSLSDGTVQTVVSSGTVHTSVRVTASIASPALSTQSGALTVTAGLPASLAFSIAVGAATYGTAASTLACPNVEAAGIDGVTVPVTVRLADRYNNPVPDGTPVAFSTDGGHIVGSCITPSSTSTPGDGTCSVTWTSANPRPGIDPSTGLVSLGYGYPVGYPALLSADRATVFATTIGEESFNDANGSGFYQLGDVFEHLGEPYRDDNENGQYNKGETFIDFNDDGVWTPTTNLFVGITCTGITPGSTCSSDSLAIGASHLIIMSTSLAHVPSFSSSGFTAQAGSTASAPKYAIAASAAAPAAPNSGTITVQVEDGNTNSMAAGTVISAALDNNAIGTLEATSVTVGCSSDLGGQLFAMGFTSSTTTGNGNITVTVVSPSGSTTTFPIAIAVQ